MNRSFKTIVFVVFMALIAMGNTQCQTTGSSTVILPQGPQAAQLMKEKDEKISQQAVQIEDLKTAREKEQAEAAKAASSVKGILRANEYVEPVLPKEAIGAEAEVAQKRLPPDDPAETVRALERVMLIITGQRDEAQRKYAEVFKEIQTVRAEIEAKNQEIAKRDQDLAARDVRIVELTKAAQEEAQKHKNDVSNLIAQKDKEKADLIKEYESRERATWVLWARIISLALILGGTLLMVFLKMFPEGGGAIAAGMIIALLSMFVNWLVSQWWFMPLMCVIVVIVLVIIGFALYRAWKKRVLQEKVSAALQDLKDESTALGHDTWEKVSEHLKYRLGGKDSKWGKEQTKILAGMGLIDPQGEELLKAQASKVDTDKG